MMCLDAADITSGKASYVVTFHVRGTDYIQWFGFYFLVLHNPVIPCGYILFIFHV